MNTKISEVEKKIPSVSDLVKKTDYNAKIKDIEEIYFTIADHNKLWHTWCKDKKGKY